MHGIGDGIAYLVWLGLIFIPLGIWKAGEIILWLVSHIAWVS